MATRLAGGRMRAARALGLAAWCTLVVATSAARAQEPDARAQQPESSWRMYDEFESDDWGGYGPPGECGDACDGSLMADGECCSGGYAGGQRWWIGGGLLLWRVDGSHLPPLLTDSPFGSAPVLGLPNTEVIAGGNVSGNSWRTGYELEFGVWFDDCQSLALVGDYFDAGDDDYDYFFPGGSGRNTGRPYFNTETGTQFFRPISGLYADEDGPIQLDGTVAITYDDDFQGAGLAIRQRVYGIGDLSGFGTSTQVMVLGGYRFFSYDSQLRIDDSVTTIAGTGAGKQDYRRDIFTSDNEFHGGEFGLQAKFTQSSCWFDGMVKLAIGGHRRRATISGESAVIPANMPVVYEEGGLLTSGETNIGTNSDSRVRIIPTFRFGAGAFLTPQWTIKAGYTAIVWSGVTGAAALTPPNLAVDPRNSPLVTPGGGPAPVFPGIGGSELVAHGLDLAIEYRY